MPAITGRFIHAQACCSRTLCLSRPPIAAGPAEMHTLFSSPAFCLGEWWRAEFVVYSGGMSTAAVSSRACRVSSGISVFLRALSVMTVERVWKDLSFA